ncbi:hypothetical protein DBR47_22750 [Paucibacter sp. KBW04]|uniref:DUF6864 domain-containing function n=1 Tax=Paucibacter sp. KBW04 TaxID=2153361 RepID=UPI000F572B91|nr:hypothetical protein [Paucibacter sp. KBW04]RQO54468.1 hypothetical protein DBR47_22750 [Paucibacter sp. KBW04]
MSFISNAGAPVGQPFAPVQIRTSGRDVVSAGTVITVDNRNLEFQIAHLKVVFSFVTDAGATRLGPGSASDSTLNLTLYNFNNSIGSGTTAPLDIGTLAGRKLSLSFMVYAISPESSKTVHYTFTLGEPA